MSITGNHIDRTRREDYDILLVAKEGTKLHFDIAPLAVHFYSSTEHLRRIVNEQLKKMIKYTR